MIRIAPFATTLSRFARDLCAPDFEEIGARRPCIADASREDVAAGHFAWTTRLVDEYRSVAVFSELASYLAAAEAPFDALAAVNGLIGDELRHTRLCAEVASWFGPLDAFEIDLAGMGLPPSSAPPLVRAHEIIVRELVVAETESVTVFIAYRDATTDPAVRAAFSVLLRDEARHAATGRALRAVLEPLIPEEERARVRAVEADDRATIRAFYESAARGGPGRAFGATIEPSDLSRARARTETPPASQPSTMPLTCSSISPVVASPCSARNDS